MGAHDTFAEFAKILAIASGVGILALRLRQPLIVALIGVGILVGPVALDIVTEREPLDLLAELGIALLLFLVGLKLDLHLIRTTGPVALATGLGQVAFTSIIGFLICLALGLAVVPAIYVAVALTFSSTIIIVKLLSDKGELDDLHGRIAVGFLIVQDLVVVIVMIALTAFGGTSELGLAEQIGLVLLKGAAFLGAITLAMRILVPTALAYVARSRELLVLTAIAWAVAIAAVSEWLGFSTEVGAFLAGVALASTPYREAIGARLVSLRDFLLLFFFVALGSQLELADATSRLGEALILSVFVLIGNPIIVMVIMGAMGYRKRVSFLAGLTVAQISEFSLILVALGLSLGQIDREIVSLVTMVGLITIALSTYMILYSRQLYEWLAPALSVFERKDPRPEAARDERPLDALVVGLGRYGSQVVERLLHDGRTIAAVDYDPASLRTWGRRLEVLYGDVEDPEFVANLPLREARSVIATMPDVEVSRTLLHGLRSAGFQGPVVLTAHTQANAGRLQDCDHRGLVVVPFAQGVEPVAQLVAGVAEAPAPPGP